jgi:hypothetical protein
MGGKHDIYIIEVEGEFLVRPAVTMIDASTKNLKIRNVTDYSAWLTFPINFLVGDRLIPVSGQETKTAVLVPKIDDGTPHGKPLSGLFKYEVVIIKDGVTIPAKGESAPKVIVDP